MSTLVGRSPVTAIVGVTAVLAAALGGAGSAAARTPSGHVPAAGALAAAAAPAAAGTATDPVPSSAFPDFDADGTADLVYGVGATDGRVVVSYGGRRAQEFTRIDVGGDARTDDNAAGFGAGLLARDLNSDGYTDLVIVDSSQGGKGSAVFVVPGSTSGLRPARADRYLVPTGVMGFLGSVALVESPEPLLVLGAYVGPEVAQGGALVTYHLGADGLPDADPVVHSQRDLPGKDRAGDGFGAALAASGSLLLVGVPGKDVRTVKDAGAVAVLQYQGAGAFTGAQISQATSRVPGRPGKNDRFGAAVALSDRYAAIGVPGEDAGARDAGAVATFRVRTGTLRPRNTYSQDTSGVPGVSEAGDRFGSSVALLRACPGVTGVLVGAPAQAVGRTAGAGAAWVIPLSDSCRALQLAEGKRLGGTAVEGASLGMAVSALRTDATAADTLVLAAPGNSEEGVAGRVRTVSPPYTRGSMTVASGLLLGDGGTLTLSPTKG